MANALRVGIFTPLDLLDRGPTATGDFLAMVGDAGLDHVAVGDHVSFGPGAGSDGLIQATALAALHPTLPVHVGVYLLPLRHPVPVARQLVDHARFAPGRLVLGVGIGGEDRREVALCGVDPATRGRRMDESLSILRPLLAGEPVSMHGEFFNLDGAIIQPTPKFPIPIVVGGRSDPAIARAGRYGDGWLGIWNSPRRFAEATAAAAAEAALAGRTDYPARHAMQVWCGLGPTREAARAYLAPVMEAVYGLPFERFERYCPYGSATDIAEFLATYTAAGCTEFNLILQAADDATMVAGAAEIKMNLIN
jgi:alkanesulfonate monooxygenase SsuD/methylene tetrahydromethanopterin reductase-like flavin-dependent oxidoreductase (luciferase family)